MTFKNKEKILKYLINRQDCNNSVNQPNRILSSIKGVTESEFYNWLKILEDEKLITYQLADLPESDNFGIIIVLPAGLSYFVKKKE